jgi:hypothetical protein
MVTLARKERASVLPPASALFPRPVEVNSAYGLIVPF